MLSCVIKREIYHSSFLKQFAVTINQFYVQNRQKSESHSVRIPDNVPILKPVTQTSSSAALRIKTISKAMKAYLERSKNYEDFLKVKNTEYEIGRQHLANIMGLDVNNLTQDDIDRAIEYLLPSGLYEKKARPMMKPPSQLYPKEKAAQFDASGRPFSPFFYTKQNNYHAALHHLVGKFNELDAFEDRMIAQGILYPPKESLLNIGGGKWLTLEEMRALFLENISQNEYSFLTTALSRLAAHPYSFRCKADIGKFWKEFTNIASMDSIPEATKDESGRPFVQADGFRKWARAKVTVRGNGTGKVTINGTDITFFERLQDREQILYPLQFTGLLGEVDVEADLTGNGGKALAGAMRYGMAMCLRSFVAASEVEKMRLAGLLTRDLRIKGRKVYGRKGSRAQYTWKKR